MKEGSKEKIRKGGVKEGRTGREERKEGRNGRKERKEGTEGDGR
jgi:hypothetical protein